MTVSAASPGRFSPVNYSTRKVKTLFEHCMLTGVMQTTGYVQSSFFFVAKPFKNLKTSTLRYPSVLFDLQAVFGYLNVEVL